MILLTILFRAAGLPNPKIKEGMEAEHCYMYGALEAFNMKNGCTTCPSDEYEFATGKKGCPEVNTPNSEREIRSIKVLEEKPLTARAKLETAEILSVVSVMALLLGGFHDPHSPQFEHAKCEGCFPRLNCGINWNMSS